MHLLPLRQVSRGGPPDHAANTGSRKPLLDSTSSRSYRARHLTICRRKLAMKWKTPIIIEIAVGLEINAYACAEVK